MTRPRIGSGSFRSRGSEPRGRVTAAILVALAGCLHLAAAAEDVILVTTTSARDSGLLDSLLPAFERRSGFAVKMIALGSGEALAQAATGEADVVLSHAPGAEEAWMAQGNGESRRLVMYNDFVIVGPRGDPAGVKEAPPVEAFRKIAAAEALFVSRGDRSGTHQREVALWKRAGVDPKGRRWSRETGQGMGLTLEVTSEQGAYTLTDRGTFLAHERRLDLTTLVENDPALLNLYHVMVVNPSKFPRVNVRGGRAFADFLVSPEAQGLIGEFGREKHGRSLFTPAAGQDEVEPVSEYKPPVRSDWAYWRDLAEGLVGAFRLLVGGDPETWSVVRQSLVISLGATLPALAVGVPIGAAVALSSFRGRNLLLAAFNVGYGFPPVVVGLVLSILFFRHGPLGWLNLRFTPQAMMIAQFVLSCPIVISLTAAAIQQLDPKLRLQMLALGASRPQMLWLLAREVRLPLLAAYMAAFGSIISEVGASLMVGGNLPGSTRVLTTAIVMETSMGHYDRAIAYGIILLALVSAVVGFLTWVGQRGRAA